MLDGLSPQRRRLVVGLLAGLAVLVLLAVGAIVFRERTVPAPQDPPGPVLLVPGYGGNGDSLKFLAARLQATGRLSVVVPEVGDGTGDLNAQADALGRVAAEVVRRTGAPSVDVIGYSAGGVVARLWVRDGSGATLARRVLTLGAPQHGTSQAALGEALGGGCPAACQQLDPGSDLLRRLNAGRETPPGPRWATVRSSADRVVTPVDSAELSGALNVEIQQYCPASDAGHGDLPNDPVTWATIASTLGPGAPVAPSQPAC